MRWIPISVIVFFSGLIAYMHYVEHAGRHFATDVGGAIIAVTCAIWFISTRSWAWWWKLSAVAAFALLPLIFKYDGSRSGSAAPRFSLRFARKKDAGLDDLTGLKPASPGDFQEPRAFHRDYPGFLGPDRTGVVTGFELESDWEANPPEELWRRRIGLGWSSFAVVGRYAITQEQREDLEMVTCYDIETGEPIWAHSNSTRFSEGMGSDGPRATPQIDGELVYALGATGILDCLALATGELQWTRNVLAELESDSSADQPAKSAPDEANPGENPVTANNLMYGKSGSPLIVDDLVVVTGGKSGPLLSAYRKQSGEPVWEAGAESAGYAAPVIATIGGLRQIVAVNARSVTGHEPADGQELWRFDWPGKFPKPAQPQILDGARVLVTASYGMGTHLLQVTASGTAFSVEELWESSRMKTKFSSVCIVDGHAYGLDEGRFACISLEDGSRQWKDGRYGYGQNIMVGKLIVVQAEQGDVILLRPNPEKLEELGRFKALSSKTWNYPALAGSYLLVRNDEEAACYRVAVVHPENPEDGRPLP